MPTLDHSIAHVSLRQFHCLALGMHYIPQQNAQCKTRRQHYDNRQGSLNTKHHACPVTHPSFPAMSASTNVSSISSLMMRIASWTSAGRRLPNCSTWLAWLTLCTLSCARPFMIAQSLCSSSLLVVYISPDVHVHHAASACHPLLHSSRPLFTPSAFWQLGVLFK